MDRERRSQPSTPVAPRERRQPPLPVRFSDALLPKAQEFYDSVLPRPLQQRYERANTTVIRMKSLREKGFPIPPDFQESNLEHIVSSMHMAREYQESHPALGHVIDFDTVQILLGMHDSGELAQDIGDVNPLYRTHRDEARKRYEPIAAKKAILSQIPDPQAREQVIALYDRYIADDPNDLEVQMAHFIDKAQGTTRVAEVAFNQHRAENPQQVGAIETHLWKTIPRMMTPAMHLMVALPEQEHRAAMREIVMGELELLGKYAPAHVPQTFQKGLSAA